MSLGHLNLDANATFGVSDTVRAACVELLDRLSSNSERSAQQAERIISSQDSYSLLNPSSVHQPAQRSRALIEEARAAVRTLVDAPPDAEVIFTSGATEANNHAVLTWFLERLHGGIPGHRGTGALLVSAIEHESVAEASSRVRDWGFPVREFKSSAARSLPTLADFQSALTPEVKVISVIHGQNECGAVLPVGSFVAAARATTPQVFFHTDAVQTVGRVPVSMSDLGIDAISLSAHKFGGLSGVGAIVLHPRAKALLTSLIVGGPQQGRLRAGTENLLGIYSLGVAASESLRGLKVRCDAMRERREVLRAALRKNVAGIRFVDELIHADPAIEWLPNTLVILLPLNRDLRGDDLVVGLDLVGVACSTGSACGSGKQEGNKTLRSLGFAPSEVARAVRFSLTGREQLNDLESVALLVRDIVSRAPVVCAADTHSATTIRAIGGSEAQPI